MAKQGASVTGTDYVPYYGESTYFYPNSIALEGYGLFNVLTTTGHKSLTLQKSKYAKPNFTNMSVLDDSGTYAGNIPVPPNKSKYWLAVTWDYGFTFPDVGYDTYLKTPALIYVGCPASENPLFCIGDTLGTLNDSPWAKWMWDSDYLEGNLREFSEVIRIKKLTTGIYSLFVDDWLNGSGSTSWSLSGIKAYIYRWDPVTNMQKLIKTYIPSSGTGQFWHICNISGNTITEVNVLTDIQP